MHVHGLGVNPADGALFIATHTGLYRAPEDARTATRVGDSFQDTMGFTVVGPNRFLGSGHPDLPTASEQDLPPHLGLIESTDAGRTWRTISLLGEADFHVLRASSRTVYGYDASNDRLLASDDRGRSWRELSKPGAVVDLAVDPADTSHVLLAAAGGLQDGLYESRDAGETWARISEAVGLLGWPERRMLYLVAGDGRVYVSDDGGKRFAPRGELGSAPGAFLAAGPRKLYAALHDGTILKSSDARSWTVRLEP